MVRYRIYTEYYPNVETLTAERFQAATFYHATGFWQGAFEQSIIVEILGTEDDRVKVLQLVKDIKTENSQDSILVTVETVETHVL